MLDTTVPTELIVVLVTDTNSHDSKFERNLVEVVMSLNKAPELVGT